MPKTAHDNGELLITKGALNSSQFLPYYSLGECHYNIITILVPYIRNII